MTTCADARRLIMDLAADGPRDPVGEATLAEHVAGCPACAQILAADGTARQQLAEAQWPLARPPYLLETSRPGVFAVGDVRGGNIKRVASAVGEGSIAVAFVHQVLSQ